MVGNVKNINNIVLYELAKKIHDMSKEERLCSLKKINRSEQRGNINHFWTRVSRRIVAPEKYDVANITKNKTYNHFSEIEQFSIFRDPR